MKIVSNPIKNNRIVSDKTFAVRLLKFLEDFYPEAGSWHPIETEEYEYLCLIAKNLLDYQINTIDNEEEINYFKNLGDNLLKEDFEKYLKKL